MAFQQGLSGLATSSKALDVTGNNIANSSTVGFKQAHAHFADVYATSMQGGGGTQVGIGASIAAIAQQFTQGNITTTSNPLDIAISGTGFFGVSPLPSNAANGASQSGADIVNYTRNGQFHLDKNGYIVNDAGQVLKGTLANNNGSIPGVTLGGDKLKVAMNVGSPLASTTVDLGSTILNSRSLTPTGGVYAAVSGNTFTVPVTISSTATPPNNTLDLTVDGNAVTVTLTDGNYVSVTDIANEINNGAGGLAAQNVGARAAAVNGTIKLENTTASTDTTNPPGSIQLMSTGTANSTLGFSSNGDTPATPTWAAKTFDPSDASTYTHSTGLTVYDTQGNPYTENYYFVKTPTPGEWLMYTSLNGSQVNGTPTTTGVTNSPQVLNFNANGQLTTVPNKITTTYQVTLTNGPQVNLPISTDLSKLVQLSTSFSVGKLDQDGRAIGKLSGLSISNDGIVQATYDNGQAKNIGQIALYNFDNPNGLQSLGNNLWGQTAAAGAPTPGSPNSGVFGQLQSGATEDSNVDLTAELVNMIVQQRNYQANAQTIKTQDQIMQTLVNLR